MTDLQFDVEAAKEQLTQVFRDRISAQGAVYNLQNADIEPVAFTDLEAKVDNQETLVAEMKDALRQAQAHGGTWFNEVQPHLTAIPQAAINYATLWNQVVPLVLAELRKAVPDRARLRSLFGGLKDSIDQQLSGVSTVATSLQALKAVITADADKFSGKYAPFQELESLDRDNVTAARAAIARITAMIAAYDEEIGTDTIASERDLAIASTALKYGQKGGRAGQIAGVTIGVVFIASALHAIDDLVAAVEARLQKAEEGAEFELQLTTLTAQLLALETASSALAALDGELDDLMASVNQTIAAWQQDAAELAEVLTQLSGAQPVTAILNEFDLGRTQSKWDELRIFATQWQTMEIAARASNELVFDDSAYQTAAVETHHAVA
jgi:hypothetical protein